MGLKKKNKVSAEFSMSSLTDIIFLLLIFFMLTSNFVRVEPFELPVSDSKTVVPQSVIVSVDHNGKYTVDNVKIQQGDLVNTVRRAVQNFEDRENVSITIAAEVGTDFSRVTEIMGIAAALKVQAIIATKPSS